MLLIIIKLNPNCYSRALAALRAGCEASTITMGTDPHLCIEIDNHASLYHASGMVHGRMCPTMMMTVAHNMAAIQLIG